MQYLWKPLIPEPEKVGVLVRELGVSELTARLLVNRQITDPDLAARFLKPSLDELRDPFLMKGMGEVVNRLESALERREKILIYGDYDVDGITATVVLKRALEMLGGQVGYHIPHRLEDGYGMKREVLENSHREGYQLVVTVDCGIRDFEVCSHARELGLDLIVTDHHLPAESLPDAFAILNPHQPGCSYPDKELAAVGVALKIVQAMFERRGKGNLVPHFLKVVAIGTVADMVPLVGENRAIVKLGLRALPSASNLGLQALLQSIGLGRRIDHVDIGFKLAPRINAFTRMGGGKEIVDLFSAETPAAAAAIVEEMGRMNLLRREQEEEILAEINRQITQDPSAWDGLFPVAGGQDWHRGVLGNVAARLVHRFHRPCLVFSLGGEGAQGSGRSIPGFHLLKSLEHCAEFFERYGGHAQAVGCTLKREFANPEGLLRVRTVLETYAASAIRESDLQPVIPIEASLPIEAVTRALCEELERLAPFGTGNPVPCFATDRVVIDGGPWVLAERHLKLAARSNGTPVDVIWWRHARVASRLSVGQAVDLAYTVSREEFRGTERIVLTVKDLREHGQVSA